MQKLGVLATLLTVSLTLSSNSLQLQECCRNTIRFASGFIDDRLMIPHINGKDTFMYTFEGLPDWMTVEGSSIAGVPPPGLNGIFDIKVNYKGVTGKSSSVFSLIVGQQKSSQIPSNHSKINFFADYVSRRGAGFNFMAIFPNTDNNPENSKISLASGQPATKPTVERLAELPRPSKITVQPIRVLSQKQCTDTKIKKQQTQQKLADLNLEYDQEWKIQLDRQQQLTQKIEERDATMTELKKIRVVEDNQRRVDALRVSLNSAKEEIKAADKLISIFEQKNKEKQLYKKSLEEKRAALKKKQEEEADKLKALLESFKKDEAELQKLGLELGRMSTNISTTTYNIDMVIQTKEYADLRVANARIELQSALKYQKDTEELLVNLTKVKENITKKYTELDKNYTELSKRIESSRGLLYPIGQSGATYDEQIQSVDLEIQANNQQIKEVKELRGQYSEIAQKDQVDLAKLIQKQSEDKNSSRSRTDIEKKLSAVGALIDQLSKQLSSRKERLNKLEMDIMGNNNYLSEQSVRLRQCSIKAVEPAKKEQVKQIRQPDKSLNN